jgi:tetratricopeptide (TPR) repeat protein
MRRYKLTSLVLCLALAGCDATSAPSLASIFGFDDETKLSSSAPVPPAPPAAPSAEAPAPSPTQQSAHGDQIMAGKTFLEMEKYPEAHDAFLAATKQDSMNVHAWNGLGAADDMLGDKADALDAYEHAMSLNPKDYSVINNLGHLYIETGNVERAAKFLAPYENDPKAPEILKQNLKIAREKSQALKNPIEPDSETYADLGSYPTEGMAQGRVEEIRGLLHDDAVRLKIVSETKVTGGVPSYTIKATGRPSESICKVMNAQAFPCIPYGK